ncbi:MAG TPA: UDP-N-acetylmuramate dehydrogenase [Candidatus Saccharimonadales bacterium]|nr:UDP-N-acetylmuramate dehydrogenase [Candidatus Saccharimonadales bacterium]
MPDIKENISLAELTTFQAGGMARYFAEVSSEAEALAAMDFARTHQLPIFILAGGSNLIVSTKGFPGLVIKPSFTELVIEEEKVRAGASVTMKELVDQTIAANLAGLEWAGGLPGSFGGAIRGNAGCFGAEMKDIVSTVTSLDLHRGKKITRENSQCQFVYRGSIFKQTKNELILSATMTLTHGDGGELRKIADSHIGYRQEKHPMEHPSAGSIFKNVPVEKITKDVLAHFQSVVKTDPFPVVPAAAIIAEADVKRLKIGGAALSDKHTNYIVNLGGATGEDIVAVIEAIKTAVKNKFRISLEVEPELVGFD